MAERNYELKRLSPFEWEIPPTGGMRVPVRIFADAELLKGIVSDNASASRPSTWPTCRASCAASLAMPDAHWGYGFPIGGVAAFDAQEGGVVSPGGDRLRHQLRRAAGPHGPDAGRRCARRSRSWSTRSTTTCPAAWAPRRRSASSPRRTMHAVWTDGAAWAVAQGFGTAEDLERTRGRRRAAAAPTGRCPAAARSSAASRRWARWAAATTSSRCTWWTRCSTSAWRTRFGLAKGGVAIQDALRLARLRPPGLHGLSEDDAAGDARTTASSVPDRAARLRAARLAGGGQLPGAPWPARRTTPGPTARRIPALAVQALEATSRRQPGVARRAAGLRRLPQHRQVRGARRGRPQARCSACTARAPRAPSRPGTRRRPRVYRDVGQPVLIPGDMGRASYVLVGAPRAMEQTWGSTCHGAGRLMSRSGRHPAGQGPRHRQGAGARPASSCAPRGAARWRRRCRRPTRTWTRVVGVMHEAGITRKVARLRPIGVVKG